MYCSVCLSSHTVKCPGRVLYYRRETKNWRDYQLTQVECIYGICQMAKSALFFFLNDKDPDCLLSDSIQISYQWALSIGIAIFQTTELER